VAGGRIPGFTYINGKQRDDEKEVSDTKSR
jgi:hypothetical protein